jgi:hypothetical protein
MHHVAIVYAPRGVLFLSATHSRAARERQLAGYVREQAIRQLSPSTRDEVLELMHRGAIPTAVRRYFEAVVREWDDEWLHLESLEDASPTLLTERIKTRTPHPRFEGAGVARG